MKEPKTKRRPRIQLYFKEWREWAKLSQEELARRMGEKYITVWRYENNRRINLRLAYLAKFVEVVGCPNLWDPIAGPPGTLPPTMHMLTHLKPAYQKQVQRIVESFRELESQQQ